MFLSDLAYETSFKELVENHSWARKMVSVPLAILGLLIASYPGGHPEWSTWSNYMYQAALYIFPPDVNIGKRYTAVGIDMIIFAIFISPSTKDFLSSRMFLWFGKQSFAVYLVHGTLLRTVLCWMLYGITAQPWNETVDENGAPVQPPWIPIRPPWVVAISMPCWIVLVYICASLWTSYVDPFCAKITQKLEKIVFIEDEKTEQALPLNSVPMRTT